MNASDILKYGNGTLQHSIGDLNETQWTTTGACGVWSPKDIMAHLAAYEHVLVDVLGSHLDDLRSPQAVSYMTCRAVQAARIDFDMTDELRNNNRSESKRRAENFFRVEASIGMD